MDVTPDSRRELLTTLLEQVSRSFYLTLRVLPASVRSQIGLAYLLARTTDTIADTEIVPLERRLALLDLLRGRILGEHARPLDLSDFSKHQGHAAERVLLENTEAALALLEQSAAGGRDLIRSVLKTIISGQALDLERFAGASSSNIAALRTHAELDDYTYRVAGCVGEFWTRLCLRDHFRSDAFLAKRGSSAQQFELLGVRFGKGLQLVNILRDLPADLRSGRCYIPSDALRAAGLKPAELLDASRLSEFRPVYDGLLNTAEGHLAAGWKYTNLIPRAEVRLRLACAWPILIGIETLKRLRNANVLDGAQRIKVSRREVRRILAQSLLFYPFPAWRNLAGIASSHD